MAHHTEWITGKPEVTCFERELGFVRHGMGMVYVTRLGS
jgi:hypothetical protein